MTCAYWISQRPEAPAHMSLSHVPDLDCAILGARDHLGVIASDDVDGAGVTFEGLGPPDGSSSSSGSGSGRRRRRR